MTDTQLGLVPFLVFTYSVKFSSVGTRGENSDLRPAKTSAMMSLPISEHICILRMTAQILRHLAYILKKASWHCSLLWKTNFNGKQQMLHSFPSGLISCLVACLGKKNNQTRIFISNSL